MRTLNYKKNDNIKMIGHRNIIFLMVSFWMLSVNSPCKREFKLKTSVPPMPSVVMPRYSTHNRHLPYFCNISLSVPRRLKSMCTHA